MIALGKEGPMNLRHIIFPLPFYFLSRNLSKGPVPTTLLVNPDPKSSRSATSSATPSLSSPAIVGNTCVVR